MSAIEILAVVGVIGFIIFRQVQGEPLHGKRAVLLPAILTVVGFTDLHASNGARLQAADVTCVVIGCVGCAVIGLAFGAVTRLESRGGYLWAQLPVWGLSLWAALFCWRAIAFVLADAMHAHVAASSSTLLFSLGVNRLAQAAVIVPRAMAMGVPFAPEKDGSTFLAGLFERGGNQSPYGRRGGGDGRDLVDRERRDHEDRDFYRDDHGRSDYDDRGRSDYEGGDRRHHDDRARRDSDRRYDRLDRGGLPDRHRHHDHRDPRGEGRRRRERFGDRW
jgi:hypothetical protein